MCPNLLRVTAAGLVLELHSFTPDLHLGSPEPLVPLRWPNLRQGDKALSWEGSAGARYRARAEPARRCTDVPPVSGVAQPGACVGQPGAQCLCHARWGDSSRAAARTSPVPPARPRRAPHARPTWRPAGAAVPPPGQRRAVAVPRERRRPQGSAWRGIPQRPHRRGVQTPAGTARSPARGPTQPCPGSLPSHAEAHPAGSRPLFRHSCRRCWHSGLWGERPRWNGTAALAPHSAKPRLSP